MEVKLCFFGIEDDGTEEQANYTSPLFFGSFFHKLPHVLEIFVDYFLGKLPILLQVLLVLCSFIDFIHCF